MAIPDLRTVLYCEYDRYAQGVLISRMRDGGLDPAPIWTDVRTLDGRPWRGCVDIISGGFPCQDVSVAGKRAGVKEGNRSGLWFEYARLIDEIRPGYAFIENVAGLVSNGFDRVLCDLAKMGYDAEWGVVSAAEAGANHRRERLWILSYTDEKYFKKYRRWNQLSEESRQVSFGRRGCVARGHWQTEPAVGRVANGVEYRVDKLRLLGNGVVPQQAALAFQILSERINNAIAQL